MNLLRKSLMILALMIVAVAFAYAMKPTMKLFELQPREKLEILLPMQFGDWRAIPTSNVILADPQMRENLERIYTETLSRTYVDTRGRQIMLSIAYGEDQRDGMSIHYPEACYPAQGFQSRASRNDQLVTPFGTIQVKQLEMVFGQRREFVTYWTMIGEFQSIGKIDKKLKEMRYSLKDLIPDGLLFRVSSIGGDADQALHDHGAFVVALLGAVSQETRKRLAGI